MGTMRFSMRWLIALLLLAGCTDGPAPAGARQPFVAPLRPSPDTLTTAGPARIDLSRAPVTTLQAPLLRRGWGAGGALLGRREEASRPGPMSFALDSRGAVSLLDQVNRRLLRFDAAGALLAELPLQGETAEDLAVAGDRTFVLYYEPGADPGYRLVAHGPAGEVLQQTRLHRSIQLVTGLFAVGADLYVERRHFDQVLVARRGQLLAEAEQTQVRLGRAARGGGPRVLVGRDGDRTVVVRRVDAQRYTSRIYELALPAPLVSVDDWLVGDDGRIALSLLLAAQRRLVVIRDRAVVGDWQLPAERDHEALRWLALDADGWPVIMTSDARGAALHRLGGAR
jgi:hypothetical protein